MTDAARRMFLLYRGLRLRLTCRAEFPAKGSMPWIVPPLEAFSQENEVTALSRFPRCDHI